MNVIYEIIKLKNFVKTNVGTNNIIYKATQNLYRKLLSPLERSLINKNKSSGFESEKALFMCSLLPKRTLDTIINYYQPKTWLDVGCGTGRALKYVQKRKIKILGIENSDLAIKVSKLKTLIIKHDLTAPLNLKTKFDIVWCYEVAEHLPESAADIFIQTLVSHGNNIILSAATPGQGGEGHINEQPHSYWIGKMKNCGFSINKELTQVIHSFNELYSRNVYCFKK